MKIAVPVTTDNQIDGHFGHCESYGVFTISEGKEITEIRSIESPAGCGCSSDIGSTLSTDGVTLMLAGGIGDGALNKLNSSGIEVIRGCSGNATEVVKLYLAGLVEDNGSSCDHHDHHGHHDHEHEGHHHEHDDHHHEHGHHHHEHDHDHAHNCSCN